MFEFQKKFQCKELYNCIKSAMERGGIPANTQELGGEFPVQVNQFFVYCSFYDIF